RDPEAALARLHQLVVEGRGRDTTLFALAELSFAYADATGKRDYYLQAAVAAWAFLFPGGESERPDELDPRLRIAADVYNRGRSRPRMAQSSICARASIRSPLASRWRSTWSRTRCGGPTASSSSSCRSPSCGCGDSGRATGVRGSVRPWLPGRSRFIRTPSGRTFSVRMRGRR